MIASLIVIGSVIFGVAFLVAWLVRPDLRAWVEQPKHRFQARVRRYDQAAEDGGSTSSRPREESPHA